MHRHTHRHSRHSNSEHWPSR